MYVVIDNPYVALTPEEQSFTLENDAEQRINVNAQVGSSVNNMQNTNVTVYLDNNETILANRIISTSIKPEHLFEIENISGIFISV